MDKDKVICRCFKVTAGDIIDAVDNGAKTFEEVQEVTSCATGCGSCEDDVIELLDELNK